MNGIVTSNCCCDQPGSCCAAAGPLWSNRYCLYLNPSTYYNLGCECKCETFGAGCDQECLDAGHFCCRESEFNFCVRGAIFRIPRYDGLCQTKQPPSTYVTPCFGDNPTPPWVAPDWGSGEGGDNSYYASPSDPNFPFCECSIAPVAARIRYQCHYRLENYAGNECTYEFEGNTYPLEEFDETYVVEGKATLYCANPAGECELLCSCDEAGSLPTPLHILKIEPCETPATGLPTPPTLTFYAQLGVDAPPHLATWTLGRIGGFLAYDDCNPILPSGSAPDWCTESGSPLAGYLCEAYGSGETWSMGDLNFYSYPCQDQDCTL